MKQQTAILYVEARADEQRRRAFALRAGGYGVQAARTVAEAMALLQAPPPALVIVGRIEPAGAIIALISALGAQRPDLPVLVVIAPGSHISAQEARRAGAVGVLMEPLEDAELLATVTRAMTATQSASGGLSDAGIATDAFTGQSPAITEVYAKISAVARSAATVFITGESGTGKGVCAHAIHRQSARSDGPFVRLDCAALGMNAPEATPHLPANGGPAEAHTLLANAMARATGGSLFLDNICDLDPGLQPILLRTLQTPTRVSDKDEQPSMDNVRIICATSVDPAAAMAQGQFRADLYYRLHVLSIRMPALRARGADLNAIAKQELQRLSRQENRHFDRLSDEVLRVFSRLAWPGNVRQLLNVLHEIVVLHDGQEVTIDMIPPELFPNPAPADGRDLSTSPAPFLGKTLAQIERLVIEATIVQQGGSVSRAARVLDVAPSTLYRKIEVWSATDDPDGTA